MHDPMCVAFEIKSPFVQSTHGNWKYRPALVTVWHVDPETDGSDDSCDMFGGRKRRTEAEKALVEEMAAEELRTPYYTGPWLCGFPRDPRYPRMAWVNPGDALALVTAAFSVFAWRLHRKRLTPELMSEAARIACNSFDNFQTSFILHEKDYGGDQLDQLRGLFSSLLGCYLRHLRPWWRHPKLHVWHWKIQVHPVQSFKRWAFTRCARCGGRFKWGESGTTNSWHSQGPRWFRGEPDLSHMDCSGVSVACDPEQPA